MPTCQEHFVAETLFPGSGFYIFHSLFMIVANSTLELCIGIAWRGREIRTKKRQILLWLVSSALLQILALAGLMGLLASGVLGGDRQAHFATGASYLLVRVIVNLWLMKTISPDRSTLMELVRLLLRSLLKGFSGCLQGGAKATGLG